MLSPSPLPCNEPESLEDHRIESEVDSPEALTGGETGKLGKIKPERTSLEASQSAGTGVKAPEQPRLLRREIQSTAVHG